MSPSVSLRPLVRDDAAEMADVVVRNREHLAATDPVRSERYYSTAGQAELIEALRAQHRADVTHPYVIVEDDAIIGRITLSNLVRGPLQSASVGYFVSVEAVGRGVASAALAAMIPLAFGEHRLHRLEAGTLTGNLASQKVLLHNGFVRYGLAPQFLRIAGEWQDHVLFQLLNEEWTER